MTTSQLRFLVPCLTLALAACGGGSLTLPPDGAAAKIEIKAGNGQSGRVGSTLAESLVVKVTDTQARPVAGAGVVFDFSANGSAASPANVTTDADGRAASRLVLGTRVGPVSGMAKVPVPAGVTPVQVEISATAVGDNANGIALVSGNDQSGPVGTTLPAPLVVAVTDAFGNPISGVTIEWSVTGGGSVSSPTTVTGDNGRASVTRTLGSTAGSQTTSAAAANLAGSPVTFTHNATAGSAARVIVVDGNGQSASAGTKLEKALVVRVLDEQDNPISGRAVAWVVGVGDGSSSPGTSSTDENGRARTEWTLGPNPGPNTLTAVVSGVGNGSFNATGTKLASATAISSHQPEPSTVGTPVTVGVAVDGSGGPPTGQVTVSGEGALAPCTITLANGSGSCEITLTQPGSRKITATYGGDTRFAGSVDTKSHQVSPVPNSSPTAAFTPPRCTIMLPCQFIDQSTDSEGPIASWKWEFGDGTISTDKDPQHTYAAAGPVSVKLTVTDMAGASSSVSHDMTVNSPPSAAFGPPVCSGLTCQFTDASTDPDGNATIVAWSWDFGDLGTSTLQNPSHDYPAAGPYRVTLTVTDDHGVTSTVSQDIIVP